MMQPVKYILGVLLLAGLWSCKKDKSDYLYQELPQSTPLTASTVRLMNMGRKATELIINDTPLTSLRPPNIEGGYLANETRPTIYFQSGRLGSTYTIPQKFIRQDGTAHIKMGSMAFGDTSVYYPKEFDIQENVSQPTDYYNVLYGPHATGGLVVTDSVFAIPRSISPPADPQHFRIRVLNLSSGPDAAGMQGNMSLAFADGTLVNNVTNNVAPGSYSDYIELPYGTYQFKVMTADGRVVPGVPANPDEQLQLVDLATGTMMFGTNPVVAKWLSYASIHTFQPGGVYTIMICASTGFSYQAPGSNSSNSIGMNGFRVIADVTEPMNITYGRVQAVNALPGAQVTATVDGQPLQEGALAYTAASPYSTFITGAHIVTLKDASGNKLAEQSFTITGSDNYTAWVYPDADGKPALKVVANNLSGSFYNNTGNSGDNGSTSQFSVTMPLWVRFLNLSTDVPEMTITDVNGQLLNGLYVSTAAASQHLQRGLATTQQPYVQFPIQGGINTFYVYASQPNVLPGNWIREIPAMKGADFIARPALYAYTGNMPGYEAGIYTVALVGSLHPKNATDQPAKLIIIKHNK